MCLVATTTVTGLPVDIPVVEVTVVEVEAEGVEVVVEVTAVVGIIPLLTIPLSTPLRAQAVVSLLAVAGATVAILLEALAAGVEVAAVVTAVATARAALTILWVPMAPAVPMDLAVPMVPEVPVDLTALVVPRQTATSWVQMVSCTLMRRLPANLVVVVGFVPKSTLPKYSTDCSLSYSTTT